MSALPVEMKAMVLTGVKEINLQTVPIPRPGPEDVLCRVKAVAICGTDPHIIEGAHQGRWPKAYPFIPGHEWAGEVVAAGEKAARFGWKAGDRVAGTSHAGCGFCRMCTTGRYNMCENYGREDLGHRQYGHYTNGAYAEYVVHSMKSVHKIPDSISFNEGALVDTTSIALHSIKRGHVQPGDTVAIFGPGPMGLLAVQCAYAVGAGRVLLVGAGERLAKGAQYHAELVDYKDRDPVQAVLEATGGRGVDVTVDCACTVETMVQSVQVTRKGGTVVFTGVPLQPVQLPMQKIVLEEMDIFGVRANRGTCEESIPLIANGKIDVKSLITHEFPLEEFPRAYEVFTKRIDGALKVILHP
ncbi:MAG: L-iditol 2-dehydrogenase [Clostridia bacterium]|nr:L-iditol 2-dehydrogenase [Clostridia bacterium]